MNHAYRTFKSGRTVRVALGIAILTSGTAFAASSGSTDIYRNEFAQSPEPAMILASAPVPEYRGGTTDIYGDQFARSFEPAASPIPFERVIACTGGATDIYRNEFQNGFATEQLARLASCP